jgi:hypothetical protein
LRGAIVTDAILASLGMISPRLHVRHVEDLCKGAQVLWIHDEMRREADSAALRGRSSPLTRPPVSAIPAVDERLPLLLGHRRVGSRRARVSSLSGQGQTGRPARSERVVAPADWSASPAMQVADDRNYPNEPPFTQSGLDSFPCRIGDPAGPQRA